jgi:hypothetical protein
MKEITLAEIENYNQMAEAALGTGAWEMIGLYREYRDEDTKKWGGNPYGYLYQIATYDWVKDDSVRFFLKTVNGRAYIYTYLDGDPADRHLLEDKDVAKAFFGA